MNNSNGESIAALSPSASGILQHILIDSPSCERRSYSFERSSHTNARNTQTERERVHCQKWQRTLVLCERIGLQLATCKWRHLVPLATWVHWLYHLSISLFVSSLLLNTCNTIIIYQKKGKREREKGRKKWATCKVGNKYTEENDRNHGHRLVLIDWITDSTKLAGPSLAAKLRGHLVSSCYSEREENSSNKSKRELVEILPASFVVLVSSQGSRHLAVILAQPFEIDCSVVVVQFKKG